MTESTSSAPLESLTFATARAALERGLAALRAGQTVFDLASLKSSDSSGVAVLLELQRQARKSGVTLSFLNLPVSLQSLLTLYGVDTLLAASPADLQHH
ncbi:STAS domain-containing protein [Massilia sp. R2A-15]|uniref:STAS domain-containing protein n=1 Tax=Massilia sp. R2A-15 TaxID=3064278 RepID=UPI002732A203|nr:STAS domain-containing protein [Massilia sp. R2A-15]WLI89179.1 STAS domain-containing protein [Massilia sp. R2A-15]